MTQSVNLIGQVFSRLTVLDRATDANGKLKWKCLCICGNVRFVLAGSLNSGTTKSCGCLRAEIQRERWTTHGYADHSVSNKKVATIPEYCVWNNMKRRCETKTNTNYRLYGARGIKVCARWRDSFENFLNDMGRRPKGYVLDRINCDGDYEPHNCRWVSPKTSTENRRNVIWIEHDGLRLTVNGWATRLGVPPSRLRLRLKRGYSVLDVLFKPPMSTRSHAASNHKIHQSDSACFGPTWSNIHPPPDLDLRGLTH